MMLDMSFHGEMETGVSVLGLLLALRWHTTGTREWLAGGTRDTAGGRCPCIVACLLGEQWPTVCSFHFAA